MPLGCRVVQGVDGKRYLQEDTEFHKVIKFFSDREFSARAISNEFARQGRRICHKTLSKFIKKNGYRRDGRGGDRAVPLNRSHLLSIADLQTNISLRISPMLRPTRSV